MDGAAVAGADLCVRSDHRKEMFHLTLHFGGAGDGARDFFSDQLTVAMTQAMDGYGDGACFHF